MLVYLCEGLDYTGHSSVGVSHICDEFPEDLDVCRERAIIAGWVVGGGVSNFKSVWCISTFISFVKP